MKIKRMAHLLHVIHNEIFEVDFFHKPDKSAAYSNVYYARESVGGYKPLFSLCIISFPISLSDKICISQDDPLTHQVELLKGALLRCYL